MSAAHKEATAAGRSFACGYGDALSYIRSEREELEADYQSARKTGDTSTLRHARDEFDEVITRLENGERVPFLRLLLGKGTDPQSTHRREHKRRVIYTMAGFTSPDHPENPELWTDKDRNASAAMLSVLSRMRRDNLTGRMGTNPMTGEPGIPPTAAFVDEGNMVTADAAGRGYLTVNLRQGRSLNSVLFFIDQQARGMQAIEKQASTESAEVNQFATVLAFKQRSKGEARAALAALRSSDDDVSSAEVDALARKLQAEEVGGRSASVTAPCGTRTPGSPSSPSTRCSMCCNARPRPTRNSRRSTGRNPVPADPRDWDINPEALLRVRTNIAATAARDPPDPDPDEASPATRTRRRRHGGACDEDLETNSTPTGIGQKPRSMWGPGDPGARRCGGSPTAPTRRHPGRARCCEASARPGRCWSSP